MDEKSDARAAAAQLPLSVAEFEGLERSVGIDRRRDRALAREMALAHGLGPPEAVWRMYEAEIGPLAQMSDDLLRELFAIHQGRAHAVGQAALTLPPEIEARLVDGKPPKRGRGRPARRSFVERRWERIAMAPVLARQTELKAAGMKADEALEKALAELPPDSPLPAGRLEDWIKHPGRSRARRVRPRRN